MAFFTGGRFRELMKKYGKVALGVHFSVSAASITGLYVAIKNNVDVESLLEKLHMGGVSSKDELDVEAPAIGSNPNPSDQFVFEESGNRPEKKRNRTAELAASSGGALALAVLCNKALFPIRVPITVALTPPIARFLARRKIIKTGLERSKGKANPIVSSLSERLRLKTMPLNIVHEANGFPRIILTEPSGSSAEVLLYGGQVVSWKNERREELLFMSSKAIWKTPKAIRGGIPVCFPQFGNLGSLEQHGFARNRLWSLDSDPSPLPPPNNLSSVDLVLKSSEEDFKTWPRSFELRLRVCLTAGKLTLIPRVRNLDNKPFSFTFALRNYLSVSDISEVRIEGLETLDYFDNLMHKERFTEQADAITFDGEIDRVYLSTPTKIAIIDHEKKRTFVLRKVGMPDAAVWNPWDKKAKALSDLGDEDYKSMLCVDSAAVENSIVLKPFEEWKGHQEISTVSSSYCSGQLDPSKVLHGFR